MICANENETWNDLYDNYSDDEVNNFEEIEDDRDYSYSSLPSFIQSILVGCTNYEGKIKFLTKFGFRYLNDKNFRKRTGKFCFLFVAGYYFGAFSNFEKALAEGTRVKTNEFYDEGLIYIVQLHPHIINERVSTISTVQTCTVENTENGEKYEYDINTDYEVNLMFGADNKIITPPSKYTVDTGCTVTNLPYLDYLNLENLEYKEFPYDEFNSNIINNKFKQPYLLNINNSKMIEYSTPVESSGHDKIKS